MLENVHNAKTKTTHRRRGRSLHKQHDLVVVHDLKRCGRVCRTHFIDELEHLLGVFVLHLALGLEVVVGLVHTLRRKEDSGEA